jgi:DNA-binding XRE family transcriptional regulator
MKGVELAAKREKCGLTQGQLAQYLGIGRTSVWRMETGEDQIPRAVEVSSETLELGNPAFEKWTEGLSAKHKLMLRRRQIKNSAREVL